MSNFVKPIPPQIRPPAPRLPPLKKKAREQVRLGSAKARDAGNLDEVSGVSLRPLFIELRERLILIRSPERAMIAVPHDGRLTPSTLGAMVERCTADWEFDLVFLQVPGVRADGVVRSELVGLGPGWMGTDLTRLFAKPARLIVTTAPAPMSGARTASGLEVAGRSKVSNQP